MRLLSFILISSAASAMLSTCGHGGQPSTDTGAASSPADSNVSESVPTAPKPKGTDGPPVAVAHGGGGGGRTTLSAANESGPDTKALDDKIAKAEKKAKASGASDTDKRATAEAYLERANVYYSAGQPQLYKFALGDFRHVLRYDPENAEAREKMDMIVSIYQQLGRPVPDNGTKP